MLYTFRTAMSVQRLGKANAMSVITVVMISDRPGTLPFAHLQRADRRALA